jgi:hypothetical protein
VVELCARAASEPASAPAFARALGRLHEIAERGELHAVGAESVRALTVEAMRGA